MSIEEENKAAARRIIEEIVNKGNLAIADELIDNDYEFHSPTVPGVKGIDGYKQMMTIARQAFPDLHIEIDDIIAEVDRVAFSFTYTGTFKNEYRGITPTGKQLSIKGLIFMRFSDGKEVESVEFWDLLEFYQQLGIPIPAQ